MVEKFNATQQAYTGNGEGHICNKPGKRQLELPETLKELQIMLQIEGDRRVTQALKAYDVKWQQSLIEKLAAERNEAERLATHAVEQKEKEVLEKYGRELAEKERALIQKELELKTVQLLLESRIPVEFKDFIRGNDERDISEKIGKLAKIWNKKLEEAK